MTQNQSKTPAELEAIKHGIDISLLEYNLTLTHEQRIQQHEGALDLLLNLTKAREALHARREQTP